MSNGQIGPDGAFAYPGVMRDVIGPFNPKGPFNPNWNRS